MIARPNKAFSILSMINLLALRALMGQSLIKISIILTAKIALNTVPTATKIKLPVNSSVPNVSTPIISPMMVSAFLTELHVRKCSPTIGDIWLPSISGITP